MPNKEYVEVLLGRLSELRNTISSLEGQVRELFEEIQAKQGQADHIIKLLEIEGVSLDAALVNGVQKAAVADKAYEKLKSLKDVAPIHYRELARAVMTDGTVIPGKDPAANLLAHISRDTRFVRLKRGMYGLSEWGNSPEARKRHRRPPKRRARQARPTG